jgi:hypothetical protein
MNEFHCLEPFFTEPISDKVMRDALEWNNQNKPALYVYNIILLSASIPRLRALLIDCFLATFN